MVGKGLKLHTTLSPDYNLKTDWEIWKEKLRMQQLNAERKNGEGTGEDKEQERSQTPPHTNTHTPKRASKNVSLYQVWWDLKSQTSKDLQLKEV